MSALLELFDVARHYAIAGGLLGLKKGVARAVDGVSLSIDQGESLGLVGESGCGKSTLARCVLGLEPLAGGRVEFQGRDINAWPEKDLRRQMQMVFQDPYSSLDPRMRVAAIVAEPLVIHSVGTRAERKATGDAPGKPTGNSTGKPTGKPKGKPAGKSAGKKPGKPKAKQ